MNNAMLTLKGSTSFSGNMVTGGSGASVSSGPDNTLNAANGSAYGPEIFVGGNVVLDVAQGDSLPVSNLGGAGNLTDPNVANHTSDPNANGSISVIGGGTVSLSGTNYYSGATTIHQGTLVLGNSATEQGTSLVTVGQNAGDNATLALRADAFLELSGWNTSNPVASTDQPVMIAQDAGSTGRVIIGNGAGSSGAAIAARVFTGGSGEAEVEFTQQFAVNSDSNDVYPFYSTLTGTLELTQSGVGTTLLEPLYGPNTFSGNVTINSGTLGTTGSAVTLGGTSLLTVNSGATFAPGQSNGINDTAVLVLAGGVLAPSTSLTESLEVLNVTAASRMDLSGGDTTLTFTFLSITAPLAIWNYSANSDAIYITSQDASGSLSQISFFSDAGQTYLGHGAFDGSLLVPIPEPSTLILACVPILVILARRRFSRT